MHLGTYFTFRSRFAAMTATMIVALLAAGMAMAEGISGLAGLEPGGTATVTSVIDGDTLVLADGRQVRLVGLQAPKLPLGRQNFKPWPLGEAAKSALSEITHGKRLQLSYGGRRTDRHNRMLAHLQGPEGEWIQGEMLRRGLARVYSFADNRKLVAEMLAIEREARIARRGIWEDPFYRVRDADRLGGEVDTFQLVEGRVVAVATVRGRTYVNFGVNWRTDFTIQISGRDRRLFEKADVAPAQLEGRLVRVRGWLTWRNGPMIDATHPEQIEMLE